MILGTVITLHVLLSAAAITNILLGEADGGWKAAWIALFLLAPVASIIGYVLVGLRYRTPEAFYRIHSKTLDKFRNSALDPAVFADDISSVGESYRPLARLIKGCNEGNIVSGGNNMEVITSGARKLELLLADLESARNFIHLEYFRFTGDKSGHIIREILERKAREGVEVRVIYPNLTNGCNKFLTAMRAAGVDVVKYTHRKLHWRLLLMRINFQDHRKIAVIDGRVAYTGGMNLNDNYFYRWRDTHLRIQGPAVAALQAAFIDVFLSSGGRLSRPLESYFPSFCPQPAPLSDKTLQIVTDAAEYPFTCSQLAYEWILNNARDYVYIQTPYFLPPPPVLDAIKSAALRGVDVRIMLPLKVDTPLFNFANQAYYDECLEAGVKILIHDGQFIHSKTLVTDDGLSIIGAINMDSRSFQINNEVNTFIYDRETALLNKHIFESDTAAPLSLDVWRSSRTAYGRILSSVMRTISFTL